VCERKEGVGERESIVLWDSFYDSWQSRVLLCVYVIRDPRAFTRAVIASSRGSQAGLAITLLSHPRQQAAGEGRGEPLRLPACLEFLAVSGFPNFAKVCSRVCARG